MLIVKLGKYSGMSDFFDGKAALTFLANFGACADQSGWLRGHVLSSLFLLYAIINLSILVTQNTYNYAGF